MAVLERLWAAGDVNLAMLSVKLDELGRAYPLPTLKSDCRELARIGWIRLETRDGNTWILPPETPAPRASEIPPPERRAPTAGRVVPMARAPREDDGGPRLRNVPLAQLYHDQCKWPISPFGAAPNSHLFCGAPRENDEDPYCERHNALAHKQTLNA